MKERLVAIERMAVITAGRALPIFQKNRLHIFHEELEIKRQRQQEHSAKYNMRNATPRFFEKRHRSGAEAGPARRCHRSGRESNQPRPSLPPGSACSARLR